MKRQLLRSLFGSAVALLLTLSAATALAERPKIGLVLGGGGARGAAHIGVLKELERHRVPIDAIAGTSMGAIIGGLYASGKTPAELEHIITTMDWAHAMSDTPSREHLSFRRKQDDEFYPITLELGLEGGDLVLPMGVVQGQHIDLILRELTLDVAHVSDFDELPIPFRAVATDIETGAAHVMGSGDLARSIRASMSVPAIFAPTELDGRMLVDGGIASNLPVDVMRQMDVDVIIAVDVEFPLYSAAELDSAVAISEQMITILMRRETLRQIDLLAAEDVLIRPALGTFDSGDFARTPDTIEPGIHGALAVSDRLQALALDEAAYSAHLAQRGRPEPIDGTLEFVRVTSESGAMSELLTSRLGVEAGDPIDPEILASAADDLFGLDHHEQVRYRLVQSGTETGVEFEARDKSWGPNVLKFAMSLENDFEGSTAFNVGTRITRTGINARGGEWQTDLQLGTDPRLVSEFYQPFGGSSNWFTAPWIDLHETNLHTFVADRAVARYRISESTLGVDIGTSIGSIGELRIGAFRGGGRGRVKVGDPDLRSFEFDAGGIQSRLRFDTRDDAHFPRSGLSAEVHWNHSLPGLGADARFDTVAADFNGTWSRGKNSWNIGASYATTYDGQGAIQDLFALGGFLRMSGLERGEISGPHAAFARLLYYRRVSESTGGLLDVPVYLGASFEAGNVWQSRSDISFDTALTGGGLFAGFDTAIGPVYLGAGFAEGGRRNYYLFFGGSPR